MKSIRYVLAASLLALVSALDACGSSNSSSTPVAIPTKAPTTAPTTAPTAVPIATAAPFAVSSVVAAPAAAAAVALPPNAPVSGSIGLGAPSAALPAGTTISAKLSNTAPSTADAPALGLLRSTLEKRYPQSSGGAIVVLAYIDLLFSHTATYPAPPGVVMTLPLDEIVNGAYYVAAYDPSRPSLGWQLGFEGPGTITAENISFLAGTGAFTFFANANYYFAVYVISKSAAAPTPAPSVAPVAPTAAPTVAPTATPSPSPTPTATGTPLPVPSPNANGEYPQTISGGATIPVAVPTGYAATVTFPAVAPTGAQSTTVLYHDSFTAPSSVPALPDNQGGLYTSVTITGPSITFASGTVSGMASSTVINSSAGGAPENGLSGTYHLALFAPGLGWLFGESNTAVDNSFHFSYTLTQPVTLVSGVTYVFAITSTQ